jgi:hypothetical protein
MSLRGTTRGLEILIAGTPQTTPQLRYNIGGLRTGVTPGLGLRLLRPRRPFAG